ncbi:hypothetical protein V8F06_014719, partial [Rhypophila decipiens]
MSHTEASKARQRRPSNLSLHHVSQPNRPFNPDREQIWNPHYQDPVLGALRGRGQRMHRSPSAPTRRHRHRLRSPAITVARRLFVQPKASDRSSYSWGRFSRRRLEGSRVATTYMPHRACLSPSTSASPAETSKDIVNSPPTPLTDTESPTAATPSRSVSLNINNHQPAGRKGFPCQVPDCPFTGPFGSERDLERHCDSKHDGAGGRAFRCRCGKLDTRKDNHDRHVPVCRKDAKTSYRCWCDHETELVTEHQEHIRHWTM